MRTFDVTEEIEIVPWYECSDRAKDVHFYDRLSALDFLRQFSTHDVVVQSLRHLIRERDHREIPTFVSRAKLLEQVAQMLATGELHLHRKPRVPLPWPMMARRQQAAAVAPLPPPRAAGPPPPPPEAPVFLPNVNPAAIAQVLTHAAQSGVPFCEE
jgi:hypothetical protein